MLKLPHQTCKTLIEIKQTFLDEMK